MDSSFRPTKRIIVVLDLAGYARSFQAHSDEEMAAFIQDYYVACEQTIVRRGGELIKFIGDACLAVFSTDLATNAVEAAVELQAAVAEISKHHQIPSALGANLHLSSAIEGEFGVGTGKRRDIIGRGVNQTFLLGRGAGIRISEPVYRALPSSARSPWNKYKPPAVYHLDSAHGIYEGLGKDPGANAQRW